jgi:hypothetical protein
MEIEQQPDADLAHPEIGQDLRFIGWDQRRNRRDFKNNRFVDQNVRANLNGRGALICRSLDLN